MNDPAKAGLVAPELRDRFVALVNTIVHSACGKDLYAYQERLVWSMLVNRRVVVNKARKVGISYLFAAFCLAVAIALGKNCAIVSPSLETSRRVMDFLREMLVKIKDKVSLQFDAESATKIRILNGGTVYALPNSPNTVRGLVIDGVIVIDEFAHFMDGADNEMFAAIGPSAARGGHIVGASTPFGERGLFHEIWARHTKHKDWDRIQINWKECPDFKLEEIRQTVISQEQFDQEYDNRFLGDIETEFPLGMLQDCVDPDLSFENPLASDNVLLGVDVGRKVDQTAIIGAVKRQDLYHVVYKKVAARVEFNAQQQMLEYLLATRKILSLIIDETGIGAMMSENLRKKNGRIVKPVTFTAQLKEELVTNAKRLLVNRQVRMPDDNQLIYALHSIKRVYTASGHLKFDAERTDLTGHADVAWAFMLALHGADKPRPIFGVAGIKRK